MTPVKQSDRVSITRFQQRFPHTPQLVCNFLQRQTPKKQESNRDLVHPKPGHPPAAAFAEANIPAPRAATIPILIILIVLRHGTSRYCRFIKLQYNLPREHRRFLMIEITMRRHPSFRFPNVRHLHEDALSTCDKTTHSYSYNSPPTLLVYVNFYKNSFQYSK